MAYSGLEEFVNVLEQRGELVRIKESVSSDLEITEIADRVMKSPGGGVAILFENCGGSMPLLINSFGSDKRMAISLGVEDIDEIGDSIDSLFKELTAPKNGVLDKLKMLPSLGRIGSYMPKKKSGRGACQEIIDLDPDITKLPILKCWPADGGRFITLPSVITEDPFTGIRNIGMYRMQVLDGESTGMHWHKHKTGARHYNGYKSLGKRMPISVALGGDPAYTFSATAPMPDNIDEYMLAGYIRKRRVELVKSVTNDIYVPSDADIIIEGYVDTSEEFIYEGPFGDHTGFYSLADYYPRFHITAVTQRKNAIYPSTIVGIPPMEDAYIQRASERIFMSPMKMVLLPEILDLDLPPAGVAHNITVTKIEKSYAGQARKSVSAMWGAGQMMLNKCMIVVDGDVDIHNYMELAKLVSERVNIETDIFFSRGPLDVLDHTSSIFTYGSKMGIDATVKCEEELVEEFEVGEFRVPTVEEVIELEGVVDARLDLVEKGISLAIISVDKSEDINMDSVAMGALRSPLLLAYKFIAVVDSGVNISDLDSVAWYMSGNIDPVRDFTIAPPLRDGEQARVWMDGTRKTKHHDNFKREWPNPVVMDNRTIELVDGKWANLGLGEMIESPSHRFKSLQRGSGAVSE